MMGKCNPEDIQLIRELQNLLAPLPGTEITPIFSIFNNSIDRCLDNLIRNFRIRKEPFNILCVPTRKTRIDMADINLPMTVIPSIVFVQKPAQTQAINTT